jgi:hypothetical protein
MNISLGILITHGHPDSPPVSRAPLKSSRNSENHHFFPIMWPSCFSQYQYQYQMLVRKTFLHFATSDCDVTQVFLWLLFVYSQTVNCERPCREKIVQGPVTPCVAAIDSHPDSLAKYCQRILLSCCFSCAAQCGLILLSIIPLLCMVEKRVNIMVDYVKTNKVWTQLKVILVNYQIKNAHYL